MQAAGRVTLTLSHACCCAPDSSCSNEMPDHVLFVCGRGDSNRRQDLSNSEIARRKDMFILWWIVVGLIAGWITGKIMKGSGYGAIMDIVIGIIGAIIGGFIMRAVGFAGEGGMIYTIIVAVIGAVILTLIFRLIKKA